MQIPKAYSVKDDGVVSKDGEVVPIINGNIVIDFGVKLIAANAAKIIVIMRSAMLDMLAYENIKPYFSNGDSSDLSKENLRYLFSPQLSCSENDEYSVIPGFTKYGISRDGKLINRETGKNKIWSIAQNAPNKNIKGGYRIAGCNNDIGKYKGIKRHRVLALVYLTPENNPDNLQVNHIDGVPGVDVLSNLEWVTPGENIKHAYRAGLITKSKSPLITRSVGGDIMKYPGLIECCEDLGIDESTLAGRLSKPNVVFDGKQFKRDDGKPFPKISRVSNGKPKERSITCRNIFTGEQFTFKTAADAGRYTGLNPLGITTNAENEQIFPVCGWNFRLTESNSAFPNHSSVYLDLYRKYQKRPPFAIQCVEDETIVFHGVTELGAWASLTPSSASRAILKKTILKGRTFKYLCPIKTLGKNISLNPITVPLQSNL